MRFVPVVAALAAVCPQLVKGHGKPTSITGDSGGTAPGLNFLAGVPLTGPNSVTEKASPVLPKKVLSQGLGKTTAFGKTTVASGVTRAMAADGATMPQVKTDGTGWIAGTWHVVTSDGGGPIRAVVDPTAKGDFTQGTELQLVGAQVPGKNGNIKPTQGQNSDKKTGNGNAAKNNIVARLVARFIEKRAVNVNEDYPFKFQIPAGMQCTGTVGTVTNACLVKITNTNKAGPFGDTAIIQQAPQGASNGTAPSTPPPTTGTPGNTNGGGGGSGVGGKNNNNNNNNKRRVARRAPVADVQPGFTHPERADVNGHQYGGKDKARRSVPFTA
ncbi:hypothetical protein JDV02_007393 [Purpureocillium takamizusanense]|uniref:CAS1 appressorium specific protein n=1 Tax=Purpureocillium takamizusanense TaxID=2060973 RepID=A0A9Q8QI67_9HYPO|nr:uncharacterized protein JDV02_007393 [Purpureocillium takamizusanense]UNI21399.1 hypothetical protein JDV02_007393 [Purpureocillium takamizusanense]